MNATEWYRTVDEYLARCFELETPPRAGELAMKLGLSPWTLSKRFSWATGKRVLEYMRQRKLEYAAALLSNTDEPIPRVYRNAGFGSRSSFFREFGEAYDVSPLRYRKGRVERRLRSDQGSSMGRQEIGLHLGRVGQ